MVQRSKATAINKKSKIARPPYTVSDHHLKFSILYIFLLLRGNTGRRFFSPDISGNSFNLIFNFSLFIPVVTLECTFLLLFEYNFIDKWSQRYQNCNIFSGMLNIGVFAKVNNTCMAVFVSILTCFRVLKLFFPSMLNEPVNFIIL